MTVVDSLPKPEFSSLIDILSYRATHQPKQTAFIFLKNSNVESERLTYAQLEQQAQSIALSLKNVTQSGDRALLLYSAGLDFITAFFGCLYAGIIAIPLYPPRPNRSIARIKAIIADAQPTIGLTSCSVFPKIERRFAENPDLQRLKWLTTDTIFQTAVLDIPSPKIAQNTLAFLQYTSGSTGLPKGVMVSHGNLLHNLEFIKKAFELTSDSVLVSWLPHFHDMGLIGNILQPLYTGCLGMLMAPITFLGRPIQWLEAISRYSATHGGAPNFAYEMCMEKISPQQKENLNLSTWKTAYSGSEPIRAATLTRFTDSFQSCGFKAEYFYPCYGLAENTLMATGGSVSVPPTYYELDADVLGKNKVKKANQESKKTKILVSCGYPRLNTQITIVNPVTLTPCSADEIGEIWVSSPSVAQGYWNKPDINQQTFQATILGDNKRNYLRTGDLGFIQDGELYITGRLKDVIIIKGENYYPQDIEQTVAHSHPALRCDGGVAFSIDVQGAEKLIIVQEVERSYRKNLDIAEVVGNICQSVLTEHDLSVYDIALIYPNTLPKTSSGKVQRLACREQFLHNRFTKVVESIIHPALGKNRV